MPSPSPTRPSSTRSSRSLPPPVATDQRAPQPAQPRRPTRSPSPPARRRRTAAAAPAEPVPDEPLARHRPSPRATRSPSRVAGEPEPQADESPSQPPTSPRRRPRARPQADDPRRKPTTRAPGRRTRAAADEAEAQAAADEPGPQADEPEPQADDPEPAAPARTPRAGALAAAAHARPAAPRARPGRPRAPAGAAGGRSSCSSSCSSPPRRRPPCCCSAATATRTPRPAAPTRPDHDVAGSPRGAAHRGGRRRRRLGDPPVLPAGGQVVAAAGAEDALALMCAGTATAVALDRRPTHRPPRRLPVGASVPVALMVTQLLARAAAASGSTRRGRSRPGPAAWTRPAAGPRPSRRGRGARSRPGRSAPGRQRRAGRVRQRPGLLPVAVRDARGECVPYGAAEYPLARRAAFVTTTGAEPQLARALADAPARAPRDHRGRPAAVTPARTRTLASRTAYENPWMRSARTRSRSPTARRPSTASSRSRPSRS